MIIKISVPNDCGSDASMEAAIAQCYAGDAEACAEDGGQALFEALAGKAKEAGLKYYSETDFGAEWEGTKAQCAKAREILPSWAYVG